MNKTIQIFLENYTCEQVRPNHWEGTFTKTRTLHKLRDNLTDADIEDLRDFACTGFHDMPINLRNSAQRKFDQYEQWCSDNGVNGYSFPAILEAAKDTTDYAEARRLTWGCLTSMIEAGYWGMADV